MNAHAHDDPPLAPGDRVRITAPQPWRSSSVNVENAEGVVEYVGRALIFVWLDDDVRVAFRPEELERTSEPG